MYIDAAYRYLLQTELAQSVGLSVTLVSPTKTAELIELPFGLRTWVGPGNHVLDGDPDSPREGAILKWGKGRPL